MEDCTESRRNNGESHPASPKQWRIALSLAEATVNHIQPRLSYGELYSASPELQSVAINLA
jgi:hypothetical protein